MPKRKAYTVREKLELITRIRNGESQAKVARETSIADSTLQGWLEGEDTSYLTVMQLGNLLRIAKTARLASRRQKKVTDYFTT